MPTDDDELQEQEWQALYRLVVKTMAQWGTDNPFGKGDYLIVDDYIVRRQQKLEVQNLKIPRGKGKALVDRLIDIIAAPWLATRHGALDDNGRAARTRNPWRPTSRKYKSRINRKRVASAER